MVRVQEPFQFDYEIDVTVRNLGVFKIFFTKVWLHAVLIHVAHVKLCCSGRGLMSF